MGRRLLLINFCNRMRAAWWSCARVQNQLLSSDRRFALHSINLDDRDSVSALCRAKGLIDSSLLVWIYVADLTMKPVVLYCDAHDDPKILRWKV